MATTIGYQVASVDNIARTLDAYSQLGFVCFLKFCTVLLY